MDRREFLNNTAAGLGGQAAGAAPRDAPVRPGEALKITRLETLLVRPRWLFLKIHTSAGIVGLGEPIVEGRAETCAAAVREIEPYLLGKDPRHVVHHWQAIYRHAFYRGGPVLTSALSGIDMALWDIKGKALGVPVYELLGGPTRRRVRVYAHARTPADLRKGLAAGFTAFKTGPFFRRNPRYLETPAQVQFAVERFAELRKAAGNDVDIAIDFHGKVSPALAKILIRALEPHNPMFVEEPVNCQNHDLMAEIARGTHLPIATGERVMTKWGFREVLEKKAATILQPDLCHAGGITEVRLIAGMAEAYYAAIAPHNPLGPISLAAGIQLAASIPNFLCQEQVSLGEGYLRQPFVVRKGYIDVPTRPGLGIELDEKALANKLGHKWRNREAYDEDDGSVVDWCDGGRMPADYDPTFKALLETNPADWLPLAGRPRRPVTLVDADIATVIRGATDKVLRVEDDPPYLVALDFQAGHDTARLPARLKLYNSTLEYRHDLLVLSVAVLLRPEADSPQLTGLLRRGFAGQKPLAMLRYKVLRVWKTPVEKFLTGGLGPLPLAPISKVPPGALPEVIRRMDERMREPAARPFAPDLWAATHVLLGLRYEQGFARALLQGVLGMRESTTYQAILAEEARRLLLMLGQKRFGSPDAQSLSALEAIEDVERLEQLVEKQQEVGSWQELLESPKRPRRNGGRKSKP